MRARSSTKGRISVAPSEQFTPTISGSACSIEVQNASTVWPERLRPLRSTAVKEIQSGSSGAASRAATIAAFAFSVSKIVSIIRMSTPPSTRPRICSAYASRTWSNVALRNAGSSTFGERESETLSGPDGAGHPRCAVELVGSLAREPGAFDAHLVRERLQRVVGLSDRGRRECVRRDDVRARLEVGAVDVADDLGTGEVEEVRVAGHVVGVVAEALAAVRLFSLDRLLDQDPVRTVEQDDPLVEKILEFFDRRPHRKRSRPKETGAVSSAAL